MENKKIQLHCPVCGCRIIDSSTTVKTELKAEKEIDAIWKPDYFQKCTRCKNQIGIRKVC